ncbi:MAG: NUDIX domain-containing protein [Candidatus Pacearchaeota archaeon]|nr:NUDIX domain-containing protein [Candidatus Pacearchaeota archaeon]
MKDYQAVAVSITNRRRDLFILQKKDGGYYIPQFRFKCCFFGGRVEDGEEEYSALRRELLEELDQKIAERIYEKSKKIVPDYKIIDALGRNCTYSLYESILSTRLLKKIASMPVKEGEAAVLIKKEDIFKAPFFSDLREVLEDYLLRQKHS